MDSILIPVTAILMPLGIVTVVTRARHWAKHRDYEHRERMRALELGISPYTKAPAGRAVPAVMALGMGVFMPAAVFLFAWLASMTADVREEAWIAALIVGGAGVFSGAKLGARLLQEQPESSPIDMPARSFVQAPQRKPAFNPDAYDTIAHRG